MPRWFLLYLSVGLMVVAAPWFAEAKIRHYRWTVKYEYKSPDCYEKLVIAVNGQFPGPTIKAQVGDTIYVDVTNQLGTEGVSIHWHGIRQYGTPWSDGAGDITQCPIMPGETFVYKFTVDRPGTYFYHAHYGMQRSSGLHGSIQVAVAEGVREPFSYHGDLSLLLNDWWHKSHTEQSTGLSLPNNSFVWVNDPQSINPPRPSHMASRFCQVGAMSSACVLGDSTGRSIKESLRKTDYRGLATRTLIMAPPYLCSGKRSGYNSHPATVQGIAQSLPADGIPFRVAISCPVARIVSVTQANVKEICGSCRIGGRYISVNSCWFSRVKLSTPPMAPRGGYKSPRRGGHSSQSSGTKQNSPPNPRRISPLGCAPPPSGASTPSGDLDNAVQIASLSYRRRTNKPVIRARITVIFEEEDEVEDSSNQASGEKTPTSSDTSSKAQDTSYIPEVQSRMEDDSIDFPSAEQTEAAKELRSLKRKALMASVEGSKKTQMDSTGSGMRIAEEEDSLDYKLYLKLPPGYDRIEDVPEGVEISWEPDPIQAAEERKQRALAREAEAEKGSSK